MVYSFLPVRLDSRMDSTPMNKDQAEELAWIIVEDFSTVHLITDGMRKELEERFLYILRFYCFECGRVYCICDD